MNFEFINWMQVVSNLTACLTTHCRGYMTLPSRFAFAVSLTDGISIEQTFLLNCDGVATCP